MSCLQITENPIKAVACRVPVRQRPYVRNLRYLPNRRIFRVNFFIPYTYGFTAIMKLNKVLSLLSRF